MLPPAPLIDSPRDTPLLPPPLSRTLHPLPSHAPLYVTFIKERAGSYDSKGKLMQEFGRHAASVIYPLYTPMGYSGRTILGWSSKYAKLAAVRRRAFAACTPVRLHSSRGRLFQRPTRTHRLFVMLASPPRPKTFSEPHRPCTRKAPSPVPPKTDRRTYHTAQAASAARAHRTAHRAPHRALKEIRLPAGLDRVTESCFADCSSMCTLSLPETVTQLNTAAFANCKALRTIQWSSKLKCIKSHCFEECHALEEVVLPASVTDLHVAAFANCCSLRSVDLAVATLIKLPEECFSHCVSLTDVRLPASLKTISDECFKKCTSLFELALPVELTEIYHGAFDGCSALTRVYPARDTDPPDGQPPCFELPEGVFSIGLSCFANCSSMKTFRFPFSIRSLPMSCFFECTALCAATFGVQTKHDMLYSKLPWLAMGSLTRGEVVAEGAGVCGSNTELVDGECRASLCSLVSATPSEDRTGCVVNFLDGCEFANSVPGGTECAYSIKKSTGCTRVGGVYDVNTGKCFSSSISSESQCVRHVPITGSSVHVLADWDPVAQKCELTHSVTTFSCTGDDCKTTAQPADICHKLFMTYLPEEDRCSY